LILKEITKISARDFTNLLDLSGTRQARLVFVYRKHTPGDTVLEQLEREAREARKGLWADRSRCRRGSGGNLRGSGG